MDVLYRSLKYGCTDIKAGGRGRKKCNISRVNSLLSLFRMLRENYRIIEL